MRKRNLVPRCYVTDKKYKSSYSKSTVFPQKYYLKSPLHVLDIQMQETISADETNDLILSVNVIVAQQCVHK